MARKRGVLEDVNTVVLPDGTKVSTFVDCDEGWLETYGVKPGDTITFDFVPGTRHAVRFRKVDAPASSKRAGKAASPAKPAKAGKTTSPAKPAKAGKVPRVKG
ncbi:MAG: hypothetical protein QM820_04830 [Minicystis sp.]